MLSSADLAYMRDAQEQALPGTIVIERYALTFPGAYETWVAVGTVLGRIYPMNRRGMSEPVLGAQVISETQWFGTLPVGTDVLAQDRLVANGRSWEIIRVNNDQMWQTAIRCELQAHNEERRT